MTVGACLKTNWIVIVGQTMTHKREVRDSGRSLLPGVRPGICGTGITQIPKD